MDIYEIEVVEPSALKVLEDLEQRKMIRLRSNDPMQEFKDLVNQIRTKAKGDRPSFTEINEEVEAVRDSRFSREK